MSRLKRQLKDQAIELRKRHMIYPEIARILGVNTTTVRYWCVQALGQTGKGRNLVCNSKVPVVKFLYEEMLRQKMSATKLARLSGVSQTAITGWMKDRRAPSYLLIETALNTLGYSLQWTQTPKQPNPRNTQPESPLSLKSSQANGQSTTPRAS